MQNPEMIDFKTTVPNFDRLFYDRLACSATFGSTLLVEGPTGSGKTTLSLQLACNFVRSTSGCVVKSDKWSNAKRLSIYIHLDEHHRERLDIKIHAFNLLGNDSEILYDYDNINQIKERDRVIAFVSGGKLDEKRQSWRERYAEDPNLKNPLPFEPYDRARKACESREREPIEPESDYDLLSILIKDILDQITECGPILLFLVVDNLNSLDSFDIPGKKQSWTVRQKYSYLRSYIQLYANKIKGPRTDILPILCVFTADEPRAEDKTPSNQVEYVSDAYIRLGSETIGPHKYSARVIEVVKASNIPHLRGKQYFAIQNGCGINIYLTPPALLGFLRRDTRKTITKLIPFNMKHKACLEIDKHLTTLGNRHGLMAYSASLVKGDVGSGRSILALHFLDGLLEDEAGLYVSLTDRTDMLRKVGERFGLEHFKNAATACVYENTNFASLDKNKKIFLLHLPSSYMVTGCFFSILDNIKQKIAERKQHLSRIVIGNLSQFALCFPNVNENEMFLPAFTEWLRYSRATCLLLDSECDHVVGDNFVARDEMFENIFIMKNKALSNGYHRYDLKLQWVNNSKYVGNIINLIVNYDGKKRQNATLNLFDPERQATSSILENPDLTI